MVVAGPNLFGEDVDVALGVRTGGGVGGGGIANRPIMDLYLAADRRPGSRVAKPWW